MRTIGLTILAVILLGTAVLAGSIEFDPFQGIVEVEVTINGHAKGRFGIDTGADRFYINREFAEKHHLPVSSKPQRSVAGIEGNSEAAAVPIRSLEIGDERVYNLDATAVDLSALITDPKATIPDGLIGYEVLRRFYITVDYPNRTMVLHQEEPSFLDDGGYSSIPFEIEHHLILVETSLDGAGEPVTVPMILDYCASHVFLTPESAERIGVDAGAGRVQLKRVTVGGRITTDSVYAGISDMSNLQRRLRRVEFGGLIGASFLYPHKITIDYSRERIYVHE